MMTNDHNKRYLNVYFTQTEYDICRYIGEMRYKITAQHVPDNRQDATQDPMQMCVDGVLTEYAVAKTLNLSFDLNCDFRQFGADLTTRDGKPLEVKSTKTVGGNLNAVKGSAEKPAAFFVLTEIHSSHVRIVGWIGRERFLHPDNLKDIGRGSFYSVPQISLVPFDEKYYKETL
jgi:hypothetical protein